MQSHCNVTSLFQLLMITRPSHSSYYAIIRKLWNRQTQKFTLSFRYYFETPWKILEQTVERLPRRTWTNTQTNMEKYNKDINFLRELLKRKAVLHVSNLFRKQRHTLFGTFIFNLQVFEGSYTRVAEHFIRSMKLTTLLHMTMFAYLPL